MPDRRRVAEDTQGGEALMVSGEAVHAVKNVGGGDAAELATCVVEKGNPLIKHVE